MRGKRERKKRLKEVREETRKREVGRGGECRYSEPLRKRVCKEDSSERMTCFTVPTLFTTRRIKAMIVLQ